MAIEIRVQRIPCTVPSVVSRGTVQILGVDSQIVRILPDFAPRHLFRYVGSIEESGELLFCRYRRHVSDPGYVQVLVE